MTISAAAVDRRRDALVLGALALLGIALHLLPGIGRPFGVHENNAGNYFGVFARNWERHGFWPVRGLPLGPHVGAEAAPSLPYLSHPPGFAWLVASFGSTEHALRAVSATGHVLAALLLYVLLRRRLALHASAVGGLAVLVLPAVAFYCQVSYESWVLPWGLALFACCDPARPGRRGRLAAAGVLAFSGVFLDWQFGFWVAALLPFLAGQAPDWRRRLLVSWLCALAGGAAMLAWRAWARTLPGLPADAGLPIADLLRVVVAWPPVATWLLACTQIWLECFTGAVLLLAGVGLPLLLWRAPGMAASLALAGLLNVVLFPSHATSHLMFHAYLTPLVAACLAAAAQVHRALAVLAVAAGALAAWRTVTTMRTADTPLFAELGATLSAAASAPESLVASNVPFLYGYYILTDRVVMTPICDPALLESARTTPPLQRGLCYLHLSAHGSALAGLSTLRQDAALAAYLARFPRQRHRELELTVRIPPLAAEVVIDAAWLYRLR